MYQRVQMLLSDTYRGAFLVPNDGGAGVWNYNYMGSSHSPGMQYALKLDQPLEFHDALHRPSHFLNFADMEEQQTGAMDQEDLYQ